jgi:L-ascorbate metabolism protein UlaG (beta-lactamase superfamily)
MSVGSTLPGQPYRGAVSDAVERVEAGDGEPLRERRAGARPEATPPAGPLSVEVRGTSPAALAPVRLPTMVEQELTRMHRQLAVRRHPSLLLHWMARWFRRPRAVRPDPLVPVRRGEVAVTFAGHATAVLRYQGLTVAFDPMLGSWIGGVRREVEPGVGLAELSEVDLVLISHRHVDHLHVPTLARLPRRATVVVPAGGAAAVSPLGFERVIELRPGAELAFRGLDLVTFPLQHGPDALAQGLSYLVRGRGPSLFLCGDGAYHAAFATIGERYAPDIALLPIGGFWPSAFRRRHMSPLDALAAFKDLSARALVPIHHGAFALSYERLGEPMRILLEVASARQLRDYVVAMEPGQTDTFSLDPSELAALDAAAALSSGGAAGGGRGGRGAGPLMARRR